MQFGFKKNTGTAQCTWLVTEVVQHFLRQGSHPIVTLLDCKAAFDICKFSCLFKKLLDAGLPPIVVRVLMFSYQHQYAWVKWGQTRSAIFHIKNGTRQGSIASPIFWAIYCDLLIKELRNLGLGAYVADQFMGASAYADDIILIAPTRHAMQLMLGVCEDYAKRYNIVFSAHPNPKESKTKCMYMIGKSKGLKLPTPLTLFGCELPWVESASHLGHTLHESGLMEHDSGISRARFIDQSVEVRQSFSFASPVEIVKALHVYCTSHYGAMLWDLTSESSNQYFNAWTTALKLAWGCPRGTRTYLVENILSCGAINAKTDILSRYAKFFKGLRESPSTEVSILCNLVSRDLRSTTGKNINFVNTVSRGNVWHDSMSKIKSGLKDFGFASVPEKEVWRVPYLETLLQQRQEWHYRGEIEEEEAVQSLIESLCVN